MNRLKMIRELRGITAEDLARTVGLPVAWYFDLEADREDWQNEISVQSLRDLARALRVPPSSLFGTAQYFENAADLAQLLRDRLTNLQLSPDQMSEKIGYDIEPLLSDPSNLLLLNADGFRSVCTEIGLDWSLAINEVRARDDSALDPDRR